MKRLHLFEFEDQQWFPSFLRDYMTDFLQFVSNKFGLYKGIMPLLTEALRKTESDQIIDLASGGGGGLLKIAEDLQKELPNLKIKLTDYYPNIDAFEETLKKGGNIFKYEKESINALDVPENLKGFRTQFLSFHHFTPEEAQQILQNAVDNNAPIAIFEAQERGIAHLIQFFFSPINVLLTAPFIRPFKIGRILFTYLIPLVPLFVWWDGLVSVVRTYSVDEMNAMVAKLNNTETYDWNVGKVKTGPMTNLYLIGTPKP